MATNAKSLTTISTIDLGDGRAHADHGEMSEASVSWRKRRVAVNSIRYFRFNPWMNALSSSCFTKRKSMKVSGLKFLARGSRIATWSNTNRIPPIVGYGTG
jgi:hypothetical protein